MYGNNNMIISEAYTCGFCWVVSCILLMLLVCPLGCYIFSICGCFHIVSILRGLAAKIFIVRPSYYPFGGILGRVVLGVL